MFALLSNKKTITKQKYLLIAIVSLCIISFGFLIFINGYKSKLPISPIVEEMFQYLEIKDCYITKIADYEDISAQLDVPVITDSEVDTYIDDVLINYEQESLTLDFVQREFDVDSLEEFYEYAREKVYDSKETEIVLKIRNEIMKTLKDESEYLLDKNAVAKYSLDVVKSYENEAFLYDMELEDYIAEVLNMNKDNFYDMCYEEGADMIKSYLVMGAFAEKESITISEEEFDNVNSQLQQTKSDEAKIYLLYQILENKIYELFITK